MSAHDDTFLLSHCLCVLTVQNEGECQHMMTRFFFRTACAFSSAGGSVVKRKVNVSMGQGGGRTVSEVTVQNEGECQHMKI